MYEVYICNEYPCLKNIFVLDIHTLRIYLYWISMYEEYICIGYPCIKNIFVLGIHV